ncbi:MAPEG family protein [Wenzhouxiangella sp. EGI_FJ10305]|uniref:MAPEG family protein n=1 Tax=Wenzhouxiangella sp. EGI_FJ10305 TaxID=3243768 RepID=UPI0035D5700A
MSFSITIFYAGLLGLVFLGLALQVVRLRRSLQVGLGSGGHESLNLAVRAHANFAEYVPMSLIMLALVEAGTAAPAWVLHLLGLGLLAGRLMHGFVGLNRSAGYTPGRFWGTALTWLVIAIAGLMLVATAVGRWII